MNSAAKASCDESVESPELFAAWTEELLGLEQAEETEQTTDLLVNCTHSELQSRGIAILHVVVGEQSTALYGRACLTLERPSAAPLPAHRITSGDIVGIFDQHAHPLSKAQPIITAVVQRVRANAITLVFDADIPVDVLDGRQLNLATVSSDVTLKRYKDVLDVLKSGRVEGPAANVVEMCFNKELKPRFYEVKSDACGRADAVDCQFLAQQSHDLNEPQQDAIRKCLRAADMAIIHGPPGTGKTTTMVAYILEAAYRKQRLLVTAPSNIAVDNLLERIVDAGFKSVVRLGHPARVSSDLHRYTLDNVVYSSDQAELCRDIKKEIDDALKSHRSGNKKAKEATRRSGAELTALRKELRQRERRAVAQVLRKTQVVFATCAGAGTLRREMRKSAAGEGEFATFDVVIIDEAAQGLEVTCWIPMLLGGKAVLAGDHQQLSATVKSTEAQRKGLDRTLFARMIERHGDEISQLLSIQYRMHSTIMGWSSGRFYDSRLVAAEAVASRTLELGEVPGENLVGTTLDSLRAPLLFVDTGGLAQYREDGEDDIAEPSRRGSGVAVHQSRCNTGEARFLVHYAKLLIKAGLKPKDITIITPYNRQVERLKLDLVEDAECQKLGIDNLRVNTVDSFQGQEADAVLISLVRSNERGVVGFLSDYRRLNVAVTRARKHVMLVGDAATISNDSMLASLYDYACSDGSVTFVQQLLDDDGKVPADPEAAAQQRQQQNTKKVEGNVNKERDRQEQEAIKEAKIRAKFTKHFQHILDTCGRNELPASLNPYERALAHEVATVLGLEHLSRGEGMQRRLCVWAPGAGPPPERPAASASSPAPVGPLDARAANDREVEDEEDEAETPLQAFERRAAALIAELAPGGPPAEWKLSKGSEELQVLERLAAAADLQLSVEGAGSKKQMRARISPAPAPAGAEAVGGGKPPGKAAPSAKAKAVAAPSASAAVDAGGNAQLADLHKEAAAARQRRAQEDAEKRRQQNEASKSELKVAKKAGKGKQAAAPAADDDDIDALLDEFQAKDSTCSFGTCKVKIHTLMDVISKCKLCNSRFCTTHAQAESHGCGDRAKLAATKQWKQECDTGMNPRGAGLAKGSASKDSAEQAKKKLQDKIKGSESSRTAKKKDK